MTFSFHFYRLKGALLTLIMVVLTYSTFAQHTPSEQKFIDEVNQLRQDPKAYIPFIIEYLEHGLEMEKKIALSELIPLLDTMKALPKLSTSEEMSRQLNMHPVDSVGKWVNHDLTWGWLKMKNIEVIMENIGLCAKEMQRMVIIRLLIDVNVPSRGHRWAILDPTINKMAVRRVVFGDINKPLQCRMWWIQEYFKQK